MTCWEILAWEFYNVAVFDKFVQFFLSYYLSSLLLLTSSVFGLLTARNCIQWSQNLSQPWMWTELQFARFQKILTSASWFHAWTPALELQTKNAMEIMCWFKRATLEIPSWEAGRDRATRLEGWQEKTRGEEKLKFILISQLSGWKEWYLESKKLSFFLNLELSYRWYWNVYFDIICADIVYPPGEKWSLFTSFCSNQRFSWCI